jgi:GNAT superfamily N-acetyltransferase
MVRRSSGVAAASAWTRRAIVPSFLIFSPPRSASSVSEMFVERRSWRLGVRRMTPRACSRSTIPDAVRVGFMVERQYTIKALDESTWAAFAALVERNNGVFGGCWCMGFHPEGVGRGTTPALNRDRKRARVRAGTAHAALVFDGDECMGWCQFGAPDELPRIKSRAAYEKGRTSVPDWRIGCCYVGRGHRRQGVAAAALAGAVDLIAGLGGGTVEGYPEDAGSVPAGFLYNGALPTYEKLGFIRGRQIGKHRWVVTRVVEPRS